MEVNEGLLAFGAEEVEVGFLVGVGIGVVGAEALAGEVARASARVLPRVV